MTSEMAKSACTYIGFFHYQLDPDMRRLERLHLMILKRKQSVVFNQICSDTDLLPKYTLYMLKNMHSIFFFFFFNKNIEVNLKEIRALTEQHHPDIILLESAGDCLGSYFSRDLVDYAILVIDVAGKYFQEIWLLFSIKL